MFMLAAGLVACDREAAVAEPAQAQPSAPAAVPARSLGPDPTAPESIDWSLPGPFAPDATPEMLRARFGTANVRVVEDLPMAEGETTRGIVLYPDDPTRRASLYFQDAERLRGLSLVSIEDAGSRWHYAGDVRIGMTLARLAAVNRAPVGYYGLSWDYGGYVVDWNGGTLHRPGQGVRLGTAPGASDADYPQGDSEFRSDDPRWPGAGDALVVESLQYSPPGEDDL